MEDIHLLRTHAVTADFRALVKELDAYLKVCDGDDHEFYNSYNGLQQLNHLVLAYRSNIPIACGAFKVLDEDTIEIKRMYTQLNERGKGIAALVLKELENWAVEVGYSKARLETGKNN